MVEPDIERPCQPQLNTSAGSYLRFAAMGDSATHGIGDSVEGQWRGWARILAESIAGAHHVSFCNLAVPGATTADVRRDQLGEALAHRPQIASLIVGLNDVLRSDWDSTRVRQDLLFCAAELSAQGALLLTPRFHDHSRVFRLPKLLARRLAQRIDGLNRICDEIHATYGGLRVDLATQPDIYSREFWSVDRLHPSERGHRELARGFASQLNDLGLVFPLPAESCTGTAPNRFREAQWLVTAGGPWLGRRVRDLGPWVAKLAVAEVRTRASLRRPMPIPEGVRA
jgi:lysophospholipase L1-like esterase